MHSHRGMVRKYELSLTLDVADAVRIDSAELQERIMDAVLAYEHRGRLFAGQRMPDGDSCILGLGAGVERMERSVDQRITSVDPDQLRARFPFSDASEKERLEAIKISGAIDCQIEELRELQAKLWDAYHATHDATDKGRLSVELKKFRRLIERSRSALSWKNQPWARSEAEGRSSASGAKQ